MTEGGAQQLRDEYLARLDQAIADLPWRVANELRSGIAEELDGLDVGEVQERLQQLGDPNRIAAAAREEAGPPAPAPVVVVAPSMPAPGAKPPMVDTKWFAIVGALVLGIGTFAFPLVGWVIGVALVTSSRFWRRWEKAVAILLPFGVAALVAVTSAVLKLSWVVAPTASANPLLPMSYGVWNLAVLALVLIPVGALWLLWLLRGRRTPRP